MKTHLLISLSIISILGTACAPSTVVSTAYSNTDPTTDACKIAGEACAALTPATVSDELASARAALTAFFDALNEGEYVKAAALYGGSYEELAAMNPSVDANDHAALLENACTLNGYQCLKVKSIVQQTQTASGAFTFTVEFTTAEGGLFGVGPCCGEAGTVAPLKTQFAYTVQKAGEAFRVQELPVYMP